MEALVGLNVIIPLHILMKMTAHQGLRDASDIEKSFIIWHRTHRRGFKVTHGRSTARA